MTVCCPNQTLIEYSKQAGIWVDLVDLFQRVPEIHVLRKLNAMLDLDLVRQDVVKSCGQRGHVSVDPVQILKMMLQIFLDDVKSERELMRQILRWIDFLYFLGYDLEDVIPHHSVLSKARKRWGGESPGRTGQPEAPKHHRWGGHAGLARVNTHR